MRIITLIMIIIIAFIYTRYMRAADVAVSIATIS